METSPHKSDFVHVNGIKLHYLDWGGTGDALIFLTGIGCSAHLYDHIASRFADRFHVLALTRRGQGESDYPKTGYDINTLTKDILDFMDYLHIDKVTLAGHALSGLEITDLAVTYPDRVTKLIYLDAAFDWRDILSIASKDPSMNIKPPERKKEFSAVEEYIDYVKYTRPDLAQVWNELWDQSMVFELEKNDHGYFVEKDTFDIGKALMETTVTYEPAFVRIKIPVLCFYAMSNDPGYPSYLTEEQRLAALNYWKTAWLPWRKRNIQRIKADIPHARVIEIPDGHYYCFMAQEDLVYEEISRFLRE